MTDLCSSVNPFLGVKCRRPADHMGTGYVSLLHKSYGRARHHFIWMDTSNDPEARYLQDGETRWSRYTTKTVQLVSKLPIYEL